MIGLQMLEFIAPMGFLMVAYWAASVSGRCYANPKIGNLPVAMSFWLFSILALIGSVGLISALSAFLPEPLFLIAGTLPAIGLHVRHQKCRDPNSS